MIGDPHLFVLQGWFFFLKQRLLVAFVIKTLSYI